MGYGELIEGWRTVLKMEAPNSYKIIYSVISPQRSFVRRYGAAQASFLFQRSNGGAGAVHRRVSAIHSGNRMNGPPCGSFRLLSTTTLRIPPLCRDGPLTERVRVAPTVKSRVS